MEKTDIFVIGTGPSGMAAARTARKHDPELSVTAIRREQSYVPCALPYALGGVCKVDSYLKDESKLMTGVGIEMLDGEVKRIDPVDKKVFLFDGTVYRYGKLIAAPGADAIELPGLGTDRPNVFVIRTPADIHQIMDYRKQCKKIIVVGAGYIGIEVACMMCKAGYDVTVAEMMDRVLPRTLDPEFSATAAAELQKGGVNLHLGATIKGANARQDGTVTELLLEDGSALATDAVILALGVRPRTGLLEEAGIKTARFGVVVDEHMRTSAPDVYACGDCTQFRGFVTGNPDAGNLATNAIFQGKTAALNAVGKERKLEGFLNACTTEVFGLRIGCAGLTEEAAREAGIGVACGTGISRNAYPMFDHSSEVKVKLVFRQPGREVIGGQAMGTDAVAERIDLIALAIQERLTADHLLKLPHCAHPLQSGVPAHNPIVMAAEDVK